MIQALVIRKGNQVDFLKDGVIGTLIEIPTPAEGGQITGEFYALPSNEGVYSGWAKFQAYNAANSPRDILPLWAIPVFELTMSNNSDTFIVVGTAAQYVTASGGGVALPTNLAYLNGTANPYSTCYRIHAADLLYATQTVSIPDTAGNYAIILSLPTLSGSLQLFPFGNINGVEAYPTATIAGTTYTTPANLLTFLNTRWGSVNGVSITWTLSSDNLTAIGTITNFTTSVTFGGGIIAVNPAA